MDIERMIQLREVGHNPLGYVGDDRMVKKLLLFLTALGECADKWGLHKIDEENVNPKTGEYILKDRYKHLHISRIDGGSYQHTDEFGHVVSGYIKDVHFDKRDLVLESYIKAMIRLADIGLEFDYEGVGSKRVMFRVSNDITAQFIHVYGVSNSLLVTHNMREYIQVWTYFIGLGVALGYSDTQIREAYEEAVEFGTELRCCV